jgi:hypothetical protein
MSFSPTFDRTSFAVPGVTFTVRRMGFARRTDLDFKTLAYRQRLRELEADHPPRSEEEKLLSEQLAIAVRKALAVPPEEYDAVVKADVDPLKEQLEAVIPQAIKRQRMVLNEEYVQVEARIQAEWIRAGLVAIVHREGDLPVPDGLDGMTPDQLLDYGPQPVAMEVYRALLSDGRLDGQASLNLSRPTIFGAPVDGEKKSTTAPNVVVLPAAGTSKETASAISPAA